MFIAKQRRLLIPLAALTTALVMFSATVSTQAYGADQEVIVRFGETPVGAAPASFTTALTGKGPAVRWEVVDDPTAPSGRAVAELSGDDTSYRFPLLIFDNMDERDVDVAVRFKPVSGTVDQAGGLIARAQDEDNYYVTRANALEDNVRLYSVVQGNRQQIAGVDVPVPPGQWHELRLRIKGEHIEVFLNGKKLFIATDPTFRNPGKVGLWTKADSLTHFDDLIVRAIQ